MTQTHAVGFKVEGKHLIHGATFSRVAALPLLILSCSEESLSKLINKMIRVKLVIPDKQQRNIYCAHK